MADKLDFLLDNSDGDILMNNGDLVIGDATLQLQQAILLIEPGELKHQPLIGVGIGSWMLDDQSGETELKSAIQRQFEADGMVIKKMDLKDLSKTVIVAEYV